MVEEIQVIIIKSRGDKSSFGLSTAVLKTVRVKVRGGSRPSPSANLN